MTCSSDTQYDHTCEERYAITFPAVAAGQRYLAAATRLSAKRSFRWLSWLFCRWTAPATRTNGRQPPPAPTRAIRGDGYQRRQQIHSASLTTSSPMSGRSIPREATPTPTSLDQVYQVGWIDDSDMLACGYSGSRGSLDGWSTDNRLRADFQYWRSGAYPDPALEYHRFRNDPGWRHAGGGGPLTRLLAIPPRPGIPVTYSDDNNRRYYQTGLYLQDEMVWDRWHVDVSARYDRIVSQQVTGYLRHPNRQFRRPYQRPRLAVVRPDNGLSPT